MVPKSSPAYLERRGPHVEQHDGRPASRCSARSIHAGVGLYRRDDLYIFSPKGQPYTPDSLRARYGRWLKSDAGKELGKRWQKWLVEMIERHEWAASPDEKSAPTIHGLRGAGFLIRFAAGYDVDQIANDTGATAQTVAGYMRFRDQMEVALAGHERLPLVDAGRG